MAIHDEWPEAPERAMKKFATKNPAGLSNGGASDLGTWFSQMCVATIRCGAGHH
jgi:hypothetical protein